MSHRVHIHQQVDQFLQSITPKKKEDMSESLGWVFFIEPDEVLIDSQLLRHQLKQAILQTFGIIEGRKIWSLYGEFKRRTYLSDLNQIIGHLCRKNFSDHPRTHLEEFISQLDFVQAVSPNSNSLFKHLQKSGPVCLFTEGDATFQDFKITSSMLNTLSDQVYHFSHKLDHVEGIICAYSQYQPVFIDFRQDYLIQIKKKYPETVVVLVSPNKNFNGIGSIDLQISSADELLDWVFE